MSVLCPQDTFENYKYEYLGQSDFWQFCLSTIINSFKHKYINKVSPITSCHITRLIDGISQFWSLQISQFWSLQIDFTSSDCVKSPFKDKLL